MRLVFLGSGAFGLPTLRALDATHEVALVVSQPDRPAGRRRRLTPTPVAEWAEAVGRPLLRTPDVNDEAARAAIAAEEPEALVVIAFGQKLSPELLGTRPAFNLHASLLPAYRGAAPINRAMIDGCTETGVSVIALAQRMDAGTVYAQRSLPVDPAETAGELHDRLAELGPETVGAVLDRLAAGTLEGAPQEDRDATPAPKLSRAEATVDFGQPAAAVRARVHGLIPWPGCDVTLDSTVLRLLRVRDHPGPPPSAPPGTLLEDGRIACGEGALELLEVQPRGGRPMGFDAYRNGRSLEAGTRLEPIA